MELVKEAMIEEEERNASVNNGCLFIQFRHVFQAQEAIRHPELFLAGLVGATLEQRVKYGMDSWQLLKAPPASDIRWSKIGTYDMASRIKSLFLYVLLFFICVTLVTPLTVRFL